MASNSTDWSQHFESGGYDYDFYDEVPDRLICQICAKPFRDPHLAVCCGKHFCESCLTDTYRYGWKSCPHCRTSGNKFRHVLHKGVRSEVLELEIYCSNKNEGCQWVGQLVNLQTHLTSQKYGCDYERIPCPNMCRETGTTNSILFAQSEVKHLYRKDLMHHLTSECLNRSYNCQYCHVKGTYEAIVKSHYRVCPEYPISCPNVQCNVTNIKRKELNDHLEECPEEVVECSFAEAGCRAIIRRCQLDDHMTSNMQEHLAIIMEAYRDVKRRLKELEKDQPAPKRARYQWHFC